MSRPGYRHIAMGIGQMLAVVLALIAVSCGKSRQWKADVTFEGMPTQNVDVYYQGSDGEIERATVAALDGRCEFTGMSSEPTMVEMYGRNGALLGRFVAKNGDKVKATYRSASDFTASGNKLTQQLSQAISGVDLTDTIKVNRVIAERVKQAPEDKLNAFLLGYFFYPEVDAQQSWMLASLLRRNGNSIMAVDCLMERFADCEPETVETVMPMTLIVPGDTVGEFSASGSIATIAYFSRAEHMADTMGINIEVPEEARLAVFRMVSDTADWQISRSKYVGRDVEFYWGYASVATPPIADLRISVLPYLIVTDKDGAIVYRGTDCHKAESEARRLIEAHSRVTTSAGESSSQR